MDLDKLPKGSDRETRQSFYSDLAMQLRYIKNAWRNHVMHRRGVYEEKDSREIWWHVKRTVESASNKLAEELDLTTTFSFGTATDQVLYHRP